MVLSNKKLRAKRRLEKLALQQEEATELSLPPDDKTVRRHGAQKEEHANNHVLAFTKDHLKEKRKADSLEDAASLQKLKKQKKAAGAKDSGEQAVSTECTALATTDKRQNLMKKKKKKKKKANSKKIAEQCGENVCVESGQLHDHQLVAASDKSTQSSQRFEESDFVKKKKRGEENAAVELCNHQEALAPDKNTQSFKESDLMDQRTVYVGGIPYYSTEDDIRSFFGDCGSILEVSLKTFPDSGRFRGIALITYKTEAAAQRALALDGESMGDRFLRIQRCITKPKEITKKEVYKEPPRKTEGYTRAYVGNLSWDITEEYLKGFFEGCNIDAIRFAEDNTTGEFKGYGHVDFGDDESLEMALQLNQHELLGRPIKIAYAVPPKSDGRKDRLSGKSSSSKGKVFH